VTLLFGVPGLMQDIVNEIRKNKYSVPRIKRILMGGSMMPISLLREIREIFNVESLYNCYGLTEASGLVSISLVGQLTFDNGGFPAAGIKIKVIDITTGDSLGPYQNGEIAVQASGIMKGYHGRPEATAEALSSDGWLRTGDLGYYDNEGRLHVIERLKQMIKCMDNVVTPAELEEILITHEAVAEAAVVGVASSKYGEAPTACVVVKDGFDKNLESLATELKELIAEVNLTAQALKSCQRHGEAAPVSGQKGQLVPVMAHLAPWRGDSPHGYNSTPTQTFKDFLFSTLKEVIFGDDAADSIQSAHSQQGRNILVLLPDTKLDLPPLQPVLPHWEDLVNMTNTRPLFRKGNLETLTRLTTAHEKMVGTWKDSLHTRLVTYTNAAGDDGPGGPLCSAAVVVPERSISTSSERPSRTTIKGG
ncbi:hypothetical protein HPB47_022245, partial [Ixodes persulcatus]